VIQLFTFPRRNCVHAADLKEKIDNLQHEFEQILGALLNRTTSRTSEKAQLSAAARARIALEPEHGGKDQRHDSDQAGSRATAQRR